VGNAVGSTPVPSPDGLPGNVVAVVSAVPPSLGRITEAEFREALVEQSAAAGRSVVPKPGGKGYERLEKVAFEERLDAVWIKGQAMEMGIAVTPRQVLRELARIKQRSFENEAEYHRFLRASRYTQRDVDERIELQLLSTRIQARIFRGKSGIRQLEEFVAAYSERWRARTVCAPDYVTDRCSNGPPPVDSVDPD